MNVRGSIFNTMKCPEGSCKKIQKIDLLIFENNANGDLVLSNSEW